MFCLAKHSSRNHPSGFRRTRSSRKIHLEPLEPRLALTVTAQLLEDINDTENQTWDLTPGSSTAEFTVNDFVTVGDFSYFSAFDGVHGYELWKTDGTAAGTVMVKDINPGAADSRPWWLTNVNGTLFFAATDETYGHELWKSDGTEAGTVLVKDITPGRPDSQPMYLTNVAGTLFFSAIQQGLGAELWKSDGTPDGTILVKDIMPTSISPFGSMPYNFADVNGIAYFSADDGVHGHELWKSDGTAAGTVLVKDVRSGPVGFYPFGLYNAGGTLLFSTQHFDQQSWKSDGTESGTVRLVNDPIFPSGIDTASITNVNGTLFFLGHDGNSGGLWRTNGTAGCSVLLKRDAFGPLTEVNGAVYFGSFTSERIELWKTDGTIAGTVPIKSVAAGTFGLSLQNATNVAGTLFFTAFDPATGEELWTSDGTAEGTVRVSDILPGTSPSAPRDLRAIGNKLLFTADDGLHGREPWITSPVEAPATPPHFPPNEVPCSAPPAEPPSSPPSGPPVEPGPIAFKARNYAAQLAQRTGTVTLPLVDAAAIDSLLRNQATIIAVGTPSHGGIVTISPSSRVANYTPAPEFLGTESFTFTLSDGAGNTSSATVFVTVVPDGQPQVQFDLEITDFDGSPLTTLAPGQEFLLRVTTQDIRSNPHGVFAAYLDITWDSALAVAAGPVKYSQTYSSAREGLLNPGFLDDVGAVAGISELDGGPFEVFVIPLRATGPGSLTFSSDAPDMLPQRNVLVYQGQSSGIPAGEISFDSVSIEISGSSDLLPVAVPDTITVPEDSGPAILDVLVNDPNQAPGFTLDGDTLRITGTGARDKLVVSLHGNQLRVSATLGGWRVSQRLPRSAVSQIIAHLHAGNDALTVRSNVRIPVTVHAGAGNDNVAAGGGSAVLLGNEGNDRLQGGRASDLLIGGDGQDRLADRGKTDLLIDGSTTYDNDPAALAAIRSEWCSNSSPAARAANLQAGSGVFLASLGVSLQKNTTLLDDGDVDTLLTSADWTWMFANGANNARPHGRTPGRR